MKSFFITSSGTGIGKTLVTLALMRQLRDAGKQVAAIKPVISGYDADDRQSDTALILKASGGTSADSISPWRYAAPLSPNLAAAKEGKALDFNALVKFCRASASQAGDALLVEGVGGVMVPLNQRYTVLDWMAALGWPVILVTGSYLGSISHTLTALEALKSRSLAVKGIVVSASEGSPVKLDDTAATLEKFALPPIPIVQIPRLTTNQMLTQMPPLQFLCDA